MTTQDWDIKKINIKDVAKHLLDNHSVDFNDRRALSTDDFISEHFPTLIKHMQDNGYGFLSPIGKAKLEEVKDLLQKTLKYCEENGIAIVNIYDFNEKGEGEWRICKPTLAQLEYLKFKRWFASAEGYFNKVVMQEKMIGVPDLDILMQELKDKIVVKQQERMRLQIKRKRLEQEQTNGN